MVRFLPVYLAAWLLSLVLLVIYMRSYNKQHGIYYAAYSIVTVMLNLEYFNLAAATSGDAYYMALLNIYVTMAFLAPVINGMACNICKVKSIWPRSVPLGLAVLLAALISTDSWHNGFYSWYAFDPAEGFANLAYGPLYAVFYIVMAVSLMITLGMLVANRNEKRISTRCYRYVLLMALVLLAAIPLSAILPSRFDFTPLAVLVVEGMMLLLCHRLPLYDTETVICEALDRTGEIGILTVDREYRLLGYNDALASAIPEIRSCRIDSVPEGFSLFDSVKEIIGDCELTGSTGRDIVQVGDRSFEFSADRLLMNGKQYGYQILVKDETARQKYLELVDGYNTKLDSEVRRQTKQIIEMQDNVVLGIAELVESRDNSTGGHIMRTSHVVQVLAEELKREQLFDVPDVFYENLIKAAKMHDLGKIAVEDRILRKPGRFTPEEYEQMKLHAALGGSTVSRVLEHLNEPAFVAVANNVAHYHHERWDGRGYPDHLAEEQIPLEARIMAVADVYDALVSKRCYKEGFDFSKAYDIVVEGMGSQFDPRLKECFIRCVPVLEDYYRQNHQSEIAGAEGGNE